MSRIDARSRRRRQQAELGLEPVGLFGEDNDLDYRFAEWRGMPEFVQRDLQFYRAVVVHMAVEEDLRAFEQLVGQKPKAGRLWYPAQTEASTKELRYRVSDGRPTSPRHPVYIVSKGRWEKRLRLTSRALHEMGVPHYIVVEESEARLYRVLVDDTATVLVLDPAYQRDYETCDDIGDVKGKGPGPARNFVWDHAIASGASWHWVMDDNIAGFTRLNRNLKVPVADGMVLRVMEEFVGRYENVGMAGPAYDSLIRRRNIWPPFVLNTRIYSCNLIRNDVPFRWRGRYNEDTILSLDMMKGGWLTLQFYAFLQRKAATQTMAGGNTDEFYAKEGTLPKSQMLADVHPDAALVGQRFGRWHHYVNYPQFQRGARLRLREEVSISGGTDDFGMELEGKRDDKRCSTVETG